MKYSRETSNWLHQHSEVFAEYCLPFGQYQMCASTQHKREQDRERMIGLPCWTKRKSQPGSVERRTFRGWHDDFQDPIWLRRCQCCSTFIYTLPSIIHSCISKIQNTHTLRRRGRGRGIRQQHQQTNNNNNGSTGWGGNRQRRERWNSGYKGKIVCIESAKKEIRLRCGTYS